MFFTLLFLCFQNTFAIFKVRLAANATGNQSLGYNIKEIGDMAAIPHILNVILTFTGGLLADRLYSKGFRLITIRRALNAAGSFLPALACFCYYLISCNILAAVLIMTFIQTLMALQYPSSKVRFQDITEGSSL